MAKKSDVKVGDKFGMLTVEELVRIPVSGGITMQRTRQGARCVCECGKEWTGEVTRLGKLTSSCGCFRRLNSSRKGLSVDPLTKRPFKLWDAMMRRCYDARRHNYMDYGGRGIRVCEEWHDPNVYIQWAYLNGYDDKATIDRIDVNGDYRPENCRWTTWKQQGRNRRNNVKITAWGETKLFCEWMEDPRVVVKTRQVIRARINGGWWTPELAFSTPSGKFGTRPHATKVASSGRRSDIPLVDGEVPNMGGIVAAMTELTSAMKQLPDAERRELVDKFLADLEGA